MIEVCWAYLQNYSWKYLDELQKFLYNEFKIHINKSTLSESLKIVRISRKVIIKVILKHSEICYNDHCEKIVYYTADQIVAINKSAVTEHTKYYHHEWSLFNITSYVHNLFHQTEHQSILPTYTKNEVLCHLIWKSSINTVRMLAFLEEVVLPHCNAYLRPQSVLLINNCSIYHNKASSILSYYQNADVKVINNNKDSSVLTRSSVYTICAHNMILNSSSYLPTC